MVEAHYAVPALNAVLNTLNTRLDARAARLADEPLRVRGPDHRPRARADDRPRRCASCARRTAARRSSSTSATASTRGAGERLGAHEYEALLAAHAPLAGARRPGRRVGRDRGLVHVGDDRRPEGRRHASPRRLPQRGLQRGDLDHAALPALPVDAADVPLQRLVLPVDRRDARRHARLPAQGRGGGDPRRDARRARRPLLRARRSSTTC